MSSKIRMTIKEFNRLAEWISKMESTPEYITIEEGDATGIGSLITAYVTNNNDEGLWKKLTDYSEW